MSDPKEPSWPTEDQLRFAWTLKGASQKDAALCVAARDAAQFRRGVEAAIAVVEGFPTKGDYSPWKAINDALAELRNLRGNDDERT